MLARHWGKLLLVLAIILFPLAIYGCTPDEAAEDDPIIIADMGWETLWVANAIAEYIIEEGYEVPVNIKTMDSPVTQAALEDGDAHIMMEVWKDQLREWWEDTTEEGTVLDLGYTFSESEQGFYVPEYVIEGDEERGIEAKAPDLETVHDLKDYYELFPYEGDPDMGHLIIGVSGWEATAINEAKAHVYGLDEYYNIDEVGSTAALEGAMVGAYEAGDPIVIYYWGPAWILGEYDFVKLEEPDHDPDIMNDLSDYASGEKDLDEIDEACAFERVPVAQGASAELKEMHPDIVEMLDNMYIGYEPINQAGFWMEENEADAEDAAIWYLKNFDDRWRDWIPEDEVEQRIEESLQEEDIG